MGKQKKTGIIILILALLCLIVAGVIFLPKLLDKSKQMEEVAVSLADDYMRDIKAGPDAELLDGMIDTFLDALLSDPMIPKLVKKLVKGEDLKDIYEALMHNMTYTVTEVSEVDEDSYRVKVRIENVNALQVGKRAWENYKERYKETEGLKGIIELGISDIKTDKSQLFAFLLRDASDQISSYDRAGKMVSGEHTLYLKKGEEKWTIEVEGSYKDLLFDCAGIPHK